MPHKTANQTVPTVAVVTYDGLDGLGFAVATEVFGIDRRVAGEPPWYRFLVCGDTGVVKLPNGLRLEVPHGLEALDQADTIIVPAYDGDGGPAHQVLEMLRQAHRRGARLVSLCTGAFVLAAAGLLDGRRATTHWADCGELAARYPKVLVDPDVLYIDDGDILTSAGNAASIDLCLHLVRKDRGAAVAARIARDLVVPLYRDGGQAQFIETPMPTPGRPDLFADTLVWAQNHLADAVTVEALAARAGMSLRSFARHFTASTGTSPYRWLLRQRVQRAQRLLETTELGIDAVAHHSGLITAANLRKHFSRALLTTPQAYRNAFKERRDPLAS